MPLPNGISSDLEQPRCEYDVHWLRVPVVIAPLEELVEDLADVCNTQRMSTALHEAVEMLAGTWSQCSATSEKIGRRACCALGLLSRPKMAMAARRPLTQRLTKSTLSLSVDVMQTFVLRYLQRKGPDALAFRCVSRGCYGLNPVLPTMKPIVCCLRATNVQIVVKFCAVFATVGYTLASGIPLGFLGSYIITGYAYCIHVVGEDPSEDHEDTRSEFTTGDAIYPIQVIPVLFGCELAEAIVDAVFDPPILGIAAIYESMMGCYRPAQAALLNGATPAPFGVMPETV